MLTKLVREPLVHFLGLALLIFIVHGALNKSETVRTDRIVVTEAKLQQIAGLFAKTWQRPPSAAEFKGLIDDYVKEEIYYREALTLGLDKDDTVIRRRLRLKLEFMTDAAVEDLAPTDAELEAYLKSHAAKFAVGAAVALRQIYFDRQYRGDKVEQDAKSVLANLRTDPSLDPASLGDATLLPLELSLTSEASIAQIFGSQFADEIVKAEPGQWIGPIHSSFGLHLVRVSSVSPGHPPALAEVRDAVVREWTSEKRQALADRYFTELMKHYEVTVEPLQIPLQQAATKP